MIINFLSKTLNEATSFDDLATLDVEINHLDSDIKSIQSKISRLSTFWYQVEQVDLLEESDRAELEALNTQISSLYQQISDLKAEYSMWDDSGYTVTDPAKLAELEPEVIKLYRKASELESARKIIYAKLKEICQKLADELKISSDIESKLELFTAKKQSRKELVDAILTANNMSWVGEQLCQVIKANTGVVDEVTSSSYDVSKEDDDIVAIFTLNLHADIDTIDHLAQDSNIEDASDLADAAASKIEEYAFEYICPECELYDDADNMYLFECELIDLDSTDDLTVTIEDEKETWDYPGYHAIDITGDLNITALIKVKLKSIIPSMLK